jgi:hypothetical protein
MVRAILDGRKTQTRRIVKASSRKQSEWLTPELICKVPHGEIICGGWQMHHPHAGTRQQVGDIGVDVAHDSPLGWVKLRYAVGDVLWVKESVVTHASIPQVVGYVADGCTKTEPWEKLRVSRFMPRWASRITLEVTWVRVERLQEISEADAIAEGITDSFPEHECNSDRPFAEGYKWLWESIHGKGAWDRNDWVEVYEFRRVA